MSAKRILPLATVLLVDDERNVTEGIAVLLRRDPYETLCAHSADEALAILARCAVDVVVADESMPGTTGSELLRIVAQRFPGSARIMLTGNATLEVALKAINDGKICRLLRKPCRPDDLRRAIAEAVQASVAAAATERILDIARLETARHGDGPPAASHGRDHSSRRFGCLDGPALESLSTRELEVLALIVDGQRVGQLAKALFISQHTVRNHLKAIFRKLDVHSQEELVARSRGLRRAGDPQDDSG